MKEVPPLRLAALGTSPPKGVEEGRGLAPESALPLPLQGERWSAKQTGEGEPRKRPEHRRAGATHRARNLRQAGNQAEALVWLELKAKRLGGYHFVRQQPIGPYFADFCCRKVKLVVEIDGSQHAGSDHDRRRDAYMRAQGYSTLRFWNHDVLRHRASVCETILAALDGRLAENVSATDLRFIFAAEKSRGRPPLWSASPTTSPPIDGGEEAPAAMLCALPLPPEAGEVAPWSGDGVGEPRPSPSQADPFYHLTDPSS